MDSWDIWDCRLGWDAASDLGDAFQAWAWPYWHARDEVGDDGSEEAGGLKTDDDSSKGT